MWSKLINLFAMLLLVFQLVSPLSVLASTNSNSTNNVCYDTDNPIVAEKITLTAPKIDSVYDVDFTVTIEYDSKSEFKYYSIDNGSTWIEYTEPFVVPKDTRVIAYSTYKYLSSQKTTKFLEVVAPRIEVVPRASLDYTSSGEDGYGQLGVAFYNAIHHITLNYLSEANRITYTIEHGSNYDQTRKQWMKYDRETQTFVDVEPDFVTEEKVYTEPFNLRTYAGNGNKYYTAVVKYVAYNTNNEIITEGTAYEQAFSFERQQPFIDSRSKLVQDITTPTNGSVNYTLEFVENIMPHNITHIWYSINDGVWTRYNGETLTTNENISVKLRGGTSYSPTDGAYYTYNISNIDKEPPRVSHKLNNYNGYVELQLNSNENPTVIVYSIDDGITWLNYDSNNLPRFEDTTTVLYKGTDQLGNESIPVSITITAEMLDIIPPENPIVTISEEYLTNKDVTVSIEFSSDSVEKKYSFDTITWFDYTEPFVVSENTFIYTYAKDNMGNQSQIVIYEVYNIDKNLDDCEPTVEYCLDENGVQILDKDGKPIVKTTDEDCVVEPNPIVEYCLDENGVQILDKDGKPIVKTTDEDCIVEPTPIVEYCLDQNGVQILDKDGKPIVKTTDEDCIVKPNPIVEYCLDENGKQILDKDGKPIVKTTDTNCDVKPNPTVEYCLDENGKQILDKDGKPIIKTTNTNCDVKPNPTVEYCLDENGKQILDKDGKPIIKTTNTNCDVKPTPIVEYCLDENGKQILDKDGKPIVKTTNVDCSNKNNNEPTKPTNICDNDVVLSDVCKDTTTNDSTDDVPQTSTETTLIYYLIGTILVLLGAVLLAVRYKKLNN